MSRDPAEPAAGASPRVTPQLDGALRAASAGELAEILEHLCAAWARVRAPALAALIEQVAQPLQDERSPLGFAKRKDLEQAWIRRAETADAIELGMLAPSAAQTSVLMAIERLRMLARLGPDPRLARATARLLIEAPFSATASAPFWRTVQSVLVASADPRVVATLRDEPPGSDPPLHRRRARAIAAITEALERSRIELDAAEHERVTKLERALERILARRPRTGPVLLAAIYAEPHELKHRQVYADYLLSKGDPRGEFIALQLAEDRGQLDRAGAKRMRALLRRYQHAWLGPLAPVVTRAGVVFARGFPTQLRCRQWPCRPERTAHEPAWATVERIEQPSLALLRPETMRSLRAIATHVWNGLELLTRGEAWPAIDSLSLDVRLAERDEVEARSDGSSRLPRALEQGQGLPALRRLGLYFERSPELARINWLFAGPMGRRLERVEIGLPVMGAFRPREWQALLRASQATLEGVTFIEDGAAFWRLEREGGAAPWTRLELRQRGRRDLRRLARLVDDLATHSDFQLTLAGKLRSARQPSLRAALARHGITKS